MGSLFSALSVSCLLASAAVSFAAPAGLGNEPVRTAIPGGILEVSVPQGWESNPRLAQDNNVLAFFNPTGMAKGDQIPIWLIVDRDSLPDGSSFVDGRRAILAGGKEFGFVPTDSTQVQTADGRIVFDYTFKPPADSLHHGLGILEAPGGVVLLRYQAVSEAVWMEKKDGVISILKGLRLVKD